MSPGVGLLVNTGLAVLIAAAGLVVDSISLTILGVVLLAVALVWHLRQPRQSTVTAAAASSIGEQSPQNEISPETIDVITLRKALLNARNAANIFSGMDRIAAWHRLEAAYGPVARRYDLPTFTMEAISMRSMLRGFADYTDTFLPLLEDGHPNAARQAAKNYIHTMSE
ncbi:MAG: hypothetical protein K5821_06620 [Nitrobacter sp.]|uniref:hypothetical protein n=1 Tax=Nitrobacter sp. TaxID=29420 RepID=UPI0026076390|nr:hypothetical protein [Nitrobacter sp.]MCV0386091.1 hypothetical protein [Nitrobacter sp.]